MFHRLLLNMALGLSFAIVSFSALSADASDAHIDKVADEFEAYMSKTLAAWKIPGGAMVIVKGDRVVAMRGFGVRQNGKPERVDQHTVFRLASLSKGFASTLTGLMVAEGKMGWNDPVVAYLPDFELRDPDQTRQLTVTHLLSHTTGLPQHTHTNLIENNTPYPVIVDRLNQVQPICDVGECHAYQNVAYSVTGDVIEEVSGKPYPVLMQERIFLPLGMYDASASYEGLMSSPNRAACHVKVKSGYAACTVAPYYYNVVPAGGINASISDMGQWLRAQMGSYPQYIPPHVLEATQTPLINTAGELGRGDANSGWRKARIDSASYALGWRVYDYAGHEMVFHGGMLKGFQNTIAFLPEEQVGIVILTNSGSPVAAPLTARFFDMYLDLPGKDWAGIALARRGG